MQGTSPHLAHRSDPVPLRPRQQRPGPLLAAPDPGLTARRGLGNEFLQRTADCASGPDRIDEGGCPGGCGGCALARTVQPKPVVGPADGPDEQEADRVADRVVAGAGARGEPRASLPAGPASAALSAQPSRSTQPAPALPADPGRPLSDATRSFMGARFGQEFGEVRVHTGAGTDDYATAIRARAFTHGHDVYLRSGESESDHRLMAHELTHVLQQRGSAGAGTATATLQRAVSPELEEIDDLLSYGVFDWVITDAEAERALSILKTLPQFQQAAFFADVQQSARLRSNLPDARVPELDALAAGVAGVAAPAATLAAINDRLSYGLFDWAITDRDAVESLEMLKKLSGPPLATALAAINYQRLLDNLPDGRKSELLELHDRALGPGGTRETAEAEHPGTRLNGITFHSDHGVMKNNTADWTASGMPYGEPEWLRAPGGVISNPISQTRNTAVTLDLGLDVLPENAPPAPVQISGRSSEPALNFDFAGTMQGGRDRRIALTSTGKLPDTVRALPDREVTWTMRWGNWTHEIGRTRHTVFVTAAAPLAPAEVTEKRMRKAAEIAGTVADRVGGIDPHAMVREIMRTWGTYNLHVVYGNAWELADNIETGAQCIDIVRFVQAILGTAGVPGTATAVVMWAMPASPLVPVESAWPHGGLHTVANHPAHPTWFPGLIDANECPNAYEAALRFDYGGARRYYPGGVSMNRTYSTPEDVLFIFQCYAWLSSLGGSEFTIESIAGTYPGGSCSPGQIRCG